MKSPLELLAGLSAQTFGDSAIETPRQSAKTWRGFTFRVGELDMVFPFMGGFEILPERDIQGIPWAANWVRGVTNVRGEIYSVVDFPAYLGFDAVTSIRNATLFILPDTTVRSALLIADRLTLRTFNEYLPHRNADKAPVRLKECLSAVVVDDNRTWHVLDAAKLIGSASFLNIAA